MDTTPLGNRGKPDAKNKKGSAPDSAPPKDEPKKGSMVTEIEHDDESDEDLPFNNPLNTSGVQLPDVPENNPLPDVPAPQPAPKRAAVPGDEQPGTGRHTKERNALRALVADLRGALDDVEKNDQTKKFKAQNVSAYRHSGEVLKAMEQRDAAEAKRNPPT